MNTETLEKANELVREINDCNQELQELEKGCKIFVNEHGKITIYYSIEWYRKGAPDWLAQQINAALYEYRSAITAKRDKLQTQLNGL